MPSGTSDLSVQERAMLVSEEVIHVSLPGTCQRYLIIPQKIRRLYENRQICKIFIDILCGEYNRLSLCSSSEVSMYMESTLPEPSPER